MIKTLAICGPTASGKTALSMLLGEKIPLEIISLDSMQIYIGMDIGTAKASKEQRSRIAHHMIDIVEPSENYSVGKYRVQALAIAKEIHNKNKLPLFVGGTGLYYDSLSRSLSDEVPESDAEYRQELLLRTDTEEKKQRLWQKLYEIDKESAEAVHYNNVRRVIRAIEIYEKTGIKKSELDKRSREEKSELTASLVSLDFHNRENLYQRVDKRAEQMLKDGLYDEVCSLYSTGKLPEGSTASRGIGYKEMISHIKGEITLDEALSLIKLSSRRYAKRQLTWFRHIEDRNTVYLDDENGKMRGINSVFEEILRIVKDNWKEI